MRVEPQIGLVNPSNGWFIMECLAKMDGLGVPPLFLETPISSNKYCNDLLHLQLELG